METLYWLMFCWQIWDVVCVVVWLWDGYNTDINVWLPAQSLYIFSGAAGTLRKKQLYNYLVELWDMHGSGPCLLYKICVALTWEFIEKCMSKQGAAPTTPRYWQKVPIYDTWVIGEQTCRPCLLIGLLKACILLFSRTNAMHVMEGASCFCASPSCPNTWARDLMARDFVPRQAVQESRDFRKLHIPYILVFAFFFLGGSVRLILNKVLKP